MSGHAAEVAASHLYPGALVRVAGAGALEPMGLRIGFSDGAEAAAEVLVPLDGGAAVLAVEEYTTGAGTVISARTWAIREWTRVGADLRLRLGARIPGG
jgi:hypothetical protein